MTVLTWGGLKLSQPNHEEEKESAMSDLSMGENGKDDGVKIEFPNQEVADQAVDKILSNQPEIQEVSPPAPTFLLEDVSEELPINNLVRVHQTAEDMVIDLSVNVGALVELFESQERRKLILEHLKDIPMDVVLDGYDPKELVRLVISYPNVLEYFPAKDLARHMSQVDLFEIFGAKNLSERLTEDQLIDEIKSRLSQPTFPDSISMLVEPNITPEYKAHRAEELVTELSNTTAVALIKVLLESKTGDDKVPLEDMLFNQFKYIKRERTWWGRFLNTWFK